MTILLTGCSTGWIGSRVRALLADRDVCLLRWEMDPELSPAKPWADFVRGTRWDAVIHMAWARLPDQSYETCWMNARASMDLFDAVKDSGCPLIVNAGSCFELGEQRGCVTEEAECINPNALGLAKLRTLAHLRRLVVPYRHARIFYAWGPSQRETSLIPYVRKCYEEGREPEIKSPDMACDFVHVDDVARGLVSLLDADCEDGVYNLGSGTGRTVRSVERLIMALRGAAELDELRALEWTGSGFWADTTKTHEATGWKATEAFSV